MANNLIIRQAVHSPEGAAATLYAALRMPLNGLISTDLGSASKLVAELHQANRLKDLMCIVGSVEFCLQFFKHLNQFGFNAPSLTDGLGFPAILDSYYAAPRALMSKSTFIDQLCHRSNAVPLFVKPVFTKLFTGQVLSVGDSGELCSNNPESLIEFNACEPDTLVWVSPVVQFVAEHRFYIREGAILGSARYDLGENENPPDLDPELVSGCLALYESSGLAPAAYAMDFGLTATGETRLIELNDAWALGLYSKVLTPADYIGFLAARFSQFKPV